MKIAFFTDTYKPQVNGLVTSICVTKAELEKKGHQVLIFAPYLPGARSEKNVYRLKGITFYPQPEYTFVLPWGKDFNLRKFKNLKIDIIHNHATWGAGLIGIWLAWKLKIPSVLTYHTFWELYLHYIPAPEKLTRKINTFLAKTICDRFPVVLAPTRIIKIALEKYGTKSKVEVLPTGLPNSVFKTNKTKVRQKYKILPKTLLLSSAGRLGKEKNFDLLLKALALVKKEAGIDFKLVLMGDGPEKNNLKSLRSRLCLEENVIFTGYLDWEQVLDVFQESDLFVFASVTETQGLVVLEAMAKGTPVVAVNRMGPAEILKKQKGGWLAEPNAKDLSVKIIKALKNRDLLEKKSVQAREHALNWKVENTTEKLLDIYKSIQNKFF
jgi:1,2-diacylglycerol 3-alpha-glucosyltransferase